MAGLESFILEVRAVSTDGDDAVSRKGSRDAPSGDPGFSIASPDVAFDGARILSPAGQRRCPRYGRCPRTQDTLSARWTDEVHFFR